MDRSLTSLDNSPALGSRSYQRHVLGSRPKLRGVEHTGDANRHLSQLKPHMCICLEACCQDDQHGCKCNVCPCRNGGVNHDQAHELHARERERIAEAQEKIYTDNSAQEIHQAHIEAGNR